MTELVSTPTLSEHVIQQEDKSFEADSIARLLEGAENWDWDDMLDFMSPKKSKKSVPALPRKNLPQLPERRFRKDVSTRCIVESLSLVRVNGIPHKVCPETHTLPSSNSWFTIR